MFWYSITMILALLVDLVSFRPHQADKDLEVLLMRQQIRILDPHQGHDQECPIPIHFTPQEGAVQRRDLLGGIAHDYYRQTACLALAA